MSAHDDMRIDQFHVSSDAALGFPGLHQRIEEAFFTPDVLIPVPDTDGPVPTRYRIKAMCTYERQGDVVLLDPQPHSQIGTGAGARDVPWFDFFGLEMVPEFVAALLNLIPPESRRERGTFGVHAFRSFGQVVSGPHQDGFEFGCTYVVDLVGNGASSYLHSTSGGKGLEYQLAPGEFVIYRDSAFFHGATALEGKDPHRDALVIQFDAPEDHDACGV